MHRLFVALRPPPEIRERLLSVMSGIDSARWQTDDQLHLTLTYFGRLDGDKAELLAEVLHDVDQPAMDLSLGLFNSFHGQTKDRTSSLWIGVQPSEPLARLAASIRNRARMVGVHADNRRFVPHITLARFSGAGATVEELAPYLRKVAPPSGTWHDSRFHLFESFLRKKGSLYVPVTSYRLRGSFADQHQW